MTLAKITDEDLLQALKAVNHEEASELFHINQIPLELKNLKIWTLWKYADNPNGGKKKKHPYTVLDSDAKSNDPKTWNTLDEILGYYQKTDYDGIGFFFTEDNSYVGIDYDNCVDSDGNIDPEISEIIGLGNTYTEFSPSKTGIHQIVRVTKPVDACNNGSLKILGKDNFFPITGNRVPGTLSEINEAPELIQAVCDKIIGTQKTKEQENTELELFQEEFSSVEEIIEYAKKNNDVFKKLYTGIGKKKKYPTLKDTEIDLIDQITKYTRNNDWILEILNKSSLKRTKWDEDSYIEDLVHEFITLKENILAKQNCTSSETDDDQLTDADIDFDEQDISPEILEAAEREADDILATGDGITYILETIARVHTGDTDTQEAICISIAGQSCLNTAGIQVSVCGTSGSGKSHAVKSHLHNLPRRFKREGSLSAKAAFYHKLKPGMIIFSDDNKPSSDMEDTIKRATTNYQEHTSLFTVKDQTETTLTIPPRINWYLTHVDPQSSEQLLNRQLVFETSSDEEQKEGIFKLQGEEAETGESMHDIDLKVLVCRRIYMKIKELEPVKVIIPFAKRIKLADINNSRIFPLLLDMIRGYTIFKYKQREIDENGSLIALEEDFWRAKRLFESRAENTVTHLTTNEKKIVDFIVKHQSDRGCTVNEIADGTRLSPKQIYNLMSGKSDKEDSGLVFKIKGMRKDPYRDPLGGRPSNCYRIEEYEAWHYVDGFVTLDAESN